LVDQHQIFRLLLYVMVDILPSKDLHTVMMERVHWLSKYVQRHLVVIYQQVGVRLDLLGFVL
jgi:hypothetical protein